MAVQPVCDQSSSHLHAKSSYSATTPILTPNVLVLFLLFRRCSGKNETTGLRVGKIPHLLLYSEQEVVQKAESVSSFFFCCQFCLSCLTFNQSNNTEIKHLMILIWEVIQFWLTICVYVNTVDWHTDKLLWLALGSTMINRRYLIDKDINCKCFEVKLDEYE